MPLDPKAFKDQLSQLVSTPSVSCTQAELDMGNRGVIDLLANWLQHRGFAIDIQELPGTPAKANLIATLGKSQTGRGGLVFSGHADTVPFDEDRWSQDPFSLTIRDDKAYGLGATDMKGFFPTALAAIEPFLKSPLKEPIILLATADEETSMTGARELVNHPFPKARYAVVGEPTGLQAIRMHKGITMEKIQIQGQSAHSSNPALGNSALEAMHEVMTELKAFRQELQAKHQHPGFEIDVPTMNFGCIHGGDNPNRICGHCELELDLRTLPGMKLDALRGNIDQLLQRIADKNHIAINRESIFPGVDAFEQSSDSTLVKAVEQLIGEPSQSVAFATEAPFLQAMGMEVVVMGPGSINQAHQPDEFIDLSQIEPAVDHLQSLIKQFCL